MTCLWTEGEPVTVEMDRTGEPRRMRWQGHPQRIERVLARWRVDEGWWEDQRIWREYFEVTTSAGLFVLFHDLLTGEWRLQRVYD